MEKGRKRCPKKETPEQEQNKIVSKSETLEANSGEKQQNDEEDLLYTHKSENRGSSIQWNSAFCRKPDH